MESYFWSVGVDMILLGDGDPVFLVRSVSHALKIIPFRLLELFPLKEKVLPALYYRIKLLDVKKEDNN